MSEITPKSSEILPTTSEIHITVPKSYCNEYKKDDDYSHVFGLSLGTTKIGLLLVLILVSTIYQWKYYRVQGTQTLLSSKHKKWKIIIEAVTTTAFGILSVMFINWSRGGISSVFTLKALGVYLLVGGILGFFNFSQEMSGLNRFISKQETLEQQGLYYELDNELTPPKKIDSVLKSISKAKDEDLEEKITLTKLETIEDPFLISLSYLFIIIIVVMFLIFTKKMFHTTLCGYKSGIFDIARSKPLNGLISPQIGFVIEILIFGLINTIPPLLGPKIRGETFKPKFGAIAIFIFLIAVAVQFMFQYTGMLK